LGGVEQVRVENLDGELSENPSHSTHIEAIALHDFGRRVVDVVVRLVVLVPVEAGVDLNDENVI
jgi:hypothetical protein